MSDNAQTQAITRVTPSKDVVDWYRDAVIYQTHVRAFFDSNGDGIGDFPGLTSRLDHIADLGATAIWLLPFYPSPLRDDGYDISDYTAVNPSYGTLDDFRTFVEAAHARGIRVIIELVVNHTSDQHPWFQRARRAPPGSPERDFYVWSTTGQEFVKARIHFPDSETSNWAWDPVAHAYYWHRFFAHQPDLNFDNPQVLQEVKSVLHFWMDLGVDGFRLDAVPFLVEREGTDGEDLPETHAVLRQIRAEVQQRNPACVLLAEANLSPERTLTYFGQGDECHMAFHFPLMPRLFMAVSREDGGPIAEIVERTKHLPEGCQWALFLRNHDELVLSMLTAEERDHLWGVYAEHRRLRLHLGIRRRLATLLNGDRRRIDLMNGLLLSLPGTPVIYYGDEIGMGDNPFLGDRDGVRTPMQWSADRNAGFSQADQVALYLPPVTDPVFGYHAVNVEQQRRMRSSLLHWMRWVLRVRDAHRAVFGRGEVAFLPGENRRILAYLRSFGRQTVLCVANLSETAQATTLDLGAWARCVPVDLFGGCLFPPIGRRRYPVQLTGHGFYWLELVASEEAQARRDMPPAGLHQPDLPGADPPIPAKPNG